MNQPGNHDLLSLDVTEQVRDFYDHNPYPRPVDNLDQYRQRWRDPQRRRSDYHLFWPTKPYREDHTILVAGCGTSQAAKHALRWPEARVTGIDFSVTSIRETEKLKRRYDLANLELHQLPIERIGELDRQFNQIICTGVLHHLTDPAAGLRALRQVLKPDGAMHLMVYAAYGRAGIYMIQEYCRLMGIDASDAEIAGLAETLMALPPGHPLARLVNEAPDFRSKSGLADALLNPQDRSYTVPQLFDLIQDTGLRFGRWLRQAPYLPQCGNLARTAHTDRLTQLPVEEQYAAVELFRGTMLRHSAILYRADNLPQAQAIQFADDGWLSYIPHRLPGTIIVEERLPPGAAAVLINQNHTDTDIYLPVDPEEKQLVEAIDGKRSIRELAHPRYLKQPDGLRKIIQKLWWYDQIVFDASVQ